MNKNNKIFFKKRVTIMGLGLHGGGVGVAKFFCKQGANVTVTDLKSEEKLSESIAKLKGCKIKFVLGGHKEEDFINTDLVVKNPDVPNTSPYLQVALKNNIPVETDLSLFLRLSGHPSGLYVIGVTGTKGKSTTSSLIYHFLKTKYKRTFLAGNIGVSPLEIMSKIKKGDRVVLELSSFALENLTSSPSISVVTNILPDHLNRYGNMEDYIAAKKIIYKFQTKKDYLVLNGDDPVVKDFAKEAKSKVRFFSTSQLPKSIDVSKFKLMGAHNLSNLLAAIEVAKILKIPVKTIEKSLIKFAGVPNRQEFVKEINGVKYFNDTTATMPDATMVAINSFFDAFPGSKLIFISGGQDKGLKYGELAELIKKKVSSLILLPGTASDKIKEHLKDYPSLHCVLSMQEAVEKASSVSSKGDIVILSPAAASFNLFKNEFDRGEQFVKIVKGLK